MGLAAGAERGRRQAMRIVRTFGSFTGEGV
jgi:hypothetical protein